MFFGTPRTTAIIGNPGDGGTITFTSIGFFETEDEADNCNKYIKSKFARALLGVLKVTQDLTPGKWAYVPLQDFTPTSDIDWTQPISAIDQQLYRKYGLTDEEIAFIESHDLLANEKYSGNMLLGKSFVEDHLTKKQRKNRGEMPKYLVENSHTPIIDRETFEAVQVEMERRASLYWIPGEKACLPLHGLITCGICGKHFQRKANKGAPYWVCYTYLRRRKEACPSRKITERVLFPILESALETDDLHTQIHRISEIRVFPDGKLLVTVDGESIERTWENPSRSESWTKEMRAAQGEKTRQQFAKHKPDCDKSPYSV